MMRNFCATFLMLFVWTSWAQVDTTRSFRIDGEFRPRFEFRDGYRQLPSNDLDPAFFVSGRTRINLTYWTSKAAFHTSIQDVRIWGQNGNNPAGNLGVFEAYTDFKFAKKWWIRIGRQGVELDNGRLFARANWNQFSKSHDGLRINQKTKKLNQSFLLFYNQANASNFGNEYFVNHYKYLTVHYLTYKPNDHLTIKTLNTWDGYQALGTSNTVYARGTSGGRITFEKKDKWGVTASGYYQYGQLQTGTNVNGFYFQPEAFVQLKKLKVRLGMEYVSGSDNSVLSTESRAFSTLYGVAFRFMGHMDYFTNLPLHTNQAGLINPYLFFDYHLNKKWRAKLDFHAFLSENNVVDLGGDIADPYLGTEIDLTLNYTINNETRLDFGFSTMKATTSMELLKGGNADLTPIYSYLMFTWKPVFFETGNPKKKK